MITTKLYGRLGNQCFQKAAAIGYGIKHGIPYVVDEEPAEVHMWPRPIVIREKTHAYQELAFKPEWRNRCIVLDGYWQSEKYFAHCREEILKSFGFDWEQLEGVCSIHVRRGDYLLYPDKHPTVTVDYLHQAISYICQKTGIRLFMIFSDDIPYCKEVLNSQIYPDCRFDYSERIDEKRDMEFMSRCEHHIISNSTFSWWGAYLDRNPNKIIVSPSKDNWFGPGNQHLDTSDLIPESWIQIKY